MKRKLLTPNNLLFSIIFPLFGLILYCSVFLLLSPLTLLKGVNYYYVLNLTMLLAAVLTVFGLLFSALVIIRKTPFSSFVFHYAVQKVKASNFGLVLLPMLPIVQYIINNREILSVVNIAVILIAFLLLSIILVLLLPILFGRPDSTSVMAILGSVFAFSIYLMASVSRTFSWYEKGSFSIQLVIFCVVLGFCLLFSAKKFSGLFNMLVISLLIFNISAAVLIKDGKTVDNSQSITESPLLILAAEYVPVHTPNIYLLVYDAYVSSETMAAYGIDNTGQESLLKQNGFTLYPKTYSIGAASIDSMSRVLNASVDFYGDTRRAVAGGGVVQKVLGTIGYQTYGIFPNSFFFRGVESMYDHTVPAEDVATYKSIIPAVLSGEFRFDFEFNQISQDEFQEVKTAAFESMSGKRFVYVHSYLPSHSQNSGACLIDEVGLYKKRLAQANIEMEQDIALISEKDPEAIVIITGDHGPYLTKNCTATGNKYDVSDISRLDIQDRYGSILAIRWPVGTYGTPDEITVLQDVFPVIFAYMYGNEDFLQLRPTPNTLDNVATSGASVQNGIIFGGINDGEPLFVKSGE